MNPRTILVALVALVMAGGTAFFVKGYLNKQRADIYASLPKQKPAAEGGKVLVARKPLNAGLILKPEHLTWQAWPADGIAKNYFVSGDATRPDTLLHGAVVRRPVGVNEPITDDQVVKPGERGFLAAVLTPGMRAVSVPVTATSGIAGFVFPGDRVDIILSHLFQTGEGKEKISSQASETLLTDVRVLAVDQKTTHENGKAVVAKTVTIEVDARQAEMIAVASRLGQLSMSLRSLRRTDIANGEVIEDAERPGARGKTFTRDRDISRVIYHENGGQVVTVVRGGKAEDLRIQGTN